MTADHSTGRAARMHGPRDLRLETIPTDPVGPDDVLVRIEVVGVCGSDVHFYKDGGIGPFQVTSPLVLGHEPYGVVVAVGERVTRHEVGARVILEPGRPCGTCPECRSGSYNLCPDVRFFATPPTDGTLRDYVVTPADFAHAVPDSLSDEAAALIEPLAVCTYAVETAGVRFGDDVLISGAGPIGLLALQGARAAGATHITVTDVRDSALAHATRLGADAVINVSTGSLDELVDAPRIFIECSGSPAAMSAGIYALARRGRALLVGIGPEEAVIPIARLRRYEIELTATFRYVNSFPAAIELAASGRIDLESLITDRYGFDQISEALEAALDPAASANTIKAIVDLRR